MLGKKVLVLGAGGFIGSHLANRLHNEGSLVTGVDIKEPLLEKKFDFVLWDLRKDFWPLFDESWDEMYVLAADMGGAGFVFTGDHDADIIHNNTLININAATFAANKGARVFFSSSACVYRENPEDPRTPEDSAYPALPDSDYGWEKLFSERLYQAYARNEGLGVRIARYHNIFGPYGAWTGGREKAPAAVCRKVAEAEDGGVIELWGDGRQRRSFLYIDECVEGTIRLMQSDFAGPVNIGSEEMVTIEELARMVIEISGKKLGVVYRTGPTGVGGRCSDNALLREKLGWAPAGKLADGMKKTYAWVKKQVESSRAA